MLSTKDVAMVYETLLSSPGMTDIVKIDVKIPRKSLLLLVKVIELGLSLKDQAPKVGLMHSINMDTIEELKSVITELLKKSSLTDLYERLNSLHHE